MREMQAKNIVRLCKFNIYILRKAIIGWCCVVTALMTLYMILFPYVQDIAGVKMDALPTEILQLVGMDSLSDMANYTTYYGMIFGIILVAVSIFAATFSAGLITKEEKTKSIEFLSSLAVSRQEIYVSKYITSLVAVAAVLVGAVCSAAVCGLINGGETFSLAGVLTSAKTAGFTAVFFGAVGLFMAALSGKIGGGAAVSVVVIASYMLGYLGELLGDKAEFLFYLSPFKAFSVENSLSMDGEFIASLAVYFGIYVVLVVAGCIAYQKRDLKV